MLRLACLPFVVTLALAAPLDAAAALLKGQVSLPPQSSAQRDLGYTKTRVAAPADIARGKRADYALYLHVKTSLPISPMKEPRVLRARGLGFEPSVMACVFDETVLIKNEDRNPITVNVGDDAVGSIPPGESVKYACRVGGPHLIRVKEWPHMRGQLFIGGIGVATKPDADGRFSMNAPQGQYELRLIGSEGVVTKTEVTLAQTDVDLGTIDPNRAAAPSAAAPAAAAPAPAAAAPAKPAKEPDRAPPPPPEPVVRPPPVMKEKPPEPAKAAVKATPRPAKAPAEGKAPGKKAKPKKEDDFFELEP